MRKSVVSNMGDNKTGFGISFGNLDYCDYIDVVGAAIPGHGMENDELGLFHLQPLVVGQFRIHAVAEMHDALVLKLEYQPKGRSFVRHIERGYFDTSDSDGFPLMQHIKLALLVSPVCYFKIAENGYIAINRNFFRPIFKFRNSSDVIIMFVREENGRDLKYSLLI